MLQKQVQCSFFGKYWWCVPFTEIMMFLLLSIHGMNFNSKCGGGFLGQICRLSTGFSEAILDGNI